MQIARLALLIALTGAVFIGLLFATSINAAPWDAEQVVGYGR